MSDDTAARVGDGMRVLLRDITVVSFVDGPSVVVQSREFDQAAHGDSLERALHALTMCVIGGSLWRIARGIAAPKPCPDDVWLALTNKEGSKVMTFRLGLVPRAYLEGER